MIMLMSIFLFKQLMSMHMRIILFDSWHAYVIYIGQLFKAMALSYINTLYYIHSVW